MSSTSSNPTGAAGLSDTYQRDLENTNAALEGGITSLAPSTAVRIIDQWHGTLKNAERDELNAIANLLAALKDELQADHPDGRAIGSLMLRLGEQTTNAAAEADDARLSPKLERLGTLLSRAGTSLGGKRVESHDAEPTGMPPVAETEKGLRPNVDDQNPGKSTDRAQ